MGQTFWPFGTIQKLGLKKEFLSYKLMIRIKKIYSTNFFTHFQWLGQVMGSLSDSLLTADPADGALLGLLGMTAIRVLIEQWGDYVFNYRTSTDINTLISTGKFASG